MAIAAVGSQAGGTFANDPAASASRAYPANVTTGNLLIAVGSKLIVGGSNPWVSTDLTQSAGTASLGTIAFDGSIEFNYSGSNYIAVGVWSIPVNTGGSCTLQLLCGVSRYVILGTDEYSGADITGSRLDGSVVSASGTTGTVDSTAKTSTAGALFIGGNALAATGSGAITPDSPFSTIYEQESSSNHTGSIIQRIVTSSTNDSASWSAPTSGNYSGFAALLAVYKEAVAGGKPAYYYAST